MEIFKKIAPLKAFLEEIRRSTKSIGLVPTMGALHNGHLALIEASKAQNSFTICSIYINPTQFNNPKDLEKYPRDLVKDVEMLQKVGCDAVFCPENDQMYASKPDIKFDFGDLDKVMEGKFRPGHFSGVALVVSKLFNIVTPHNAYFGQKDWQQFAVIQRMVEELMFGLKLHSVPTVREADGLAMSSRNRRLDVNQRKQAIIFYQALLEAKKMFQAGNDVPTVKQKVGNIINKEPGIVREYFEVVDRTNLNVLEIVKGADKPIMCIAGYVGEVRLIDNMFLD
jgi:pantoate--beta-alanine ligase